MKETRVKMKITVNQTEFKFSPRLLTDNYERALLPNCLGGLVPLQQ